MSQVWSVRLARQAERDRDEILMWTSKNFGPVQTRIYATTINLSVCAGWTKLTKLSLADRTMKTFNIHEAKTHLSKLVEMAAGGEGFIIAKAGKPMVKVVALDAPSGTQQKRIGFMSGQIQVPADFDTMAAEEIISLFEGDE